MNYLIPVCNHENHMSKSQCHEVSGGRSSLGSTRCLCPCVGGEGGYNIHAARDTHTPARKAIIFARARVFRVQNTPRVSRLACNYPIAAADGRNLATRSLGAHCTRNRLQKRLRLHTQSQSHVDYVCVSHGAHCCGRAGRLTTAGGGFDCIRATVMRCARVRACVRVCA